ncbi:MAG: hypothetical protein ACTSUE_16485 [Promethearchaeota archaeon]
MLIDDVGSFPLPANRRELFDQFYLTAYNFLLKNDVDSCVDNRAFRNNFYEPIIESFLKKLSTGLDVINYPQLFSMHYQFLTPISRYGSTQSTPFLIGEKSAIVPEVLAIEHFVKNTPLEELHIPGNSASAEQVQLKVCITGPIELYIKTELGFTVYKDILENFSKSVNYFAKNSIINNEKIRTAVIVIDEPSVGFIDLFNIEKEDLTRCLDLALSGFGDGITTQIHLHSLKDVDIALNAKNIDVITCEYASDNNNIIGRKVLEDSGKKMRVGICRTNLNAIIGKLYEQGIRVGTSYEESLQLIDSTEMIRKNYEKAITHYGQDNVTFVGPDCGLSSWNPPRLAQVLLERTVNAVKK